MFENQINAHARKPDAVPINEDECALEGELSAIWALERISEHTLCTMVQQTELDPTSPSMLVLRFLLSLEFLLTRSSEVTCVIPQVLGPRTHFAAALRQLEMNLAYLDTCVPATAFRETQYETLDTHVYLDRVDCVLARVIQLKTIVSCMAAYGTDHVPAPPADRERNEQQKLLDFFFQCAANSQLRRKHSGMYRPRLLSNGTTSGFYEYHLEIPEYMYHTVTPARLYTEQYDTLTNRPSTPNQMIQLLTGLPDARCPFLNKVRTLFSYTNGIFNARTGTFQTHVNGAGRLKTTQSTANFFEYTVEPLCLTQDPMDIETPHFDKILQDQQFEDQARYWIYALCGRLLFDVGDKDDWQVTLYIRGVAGSGKSSILKTVAMIYETGDVGYMMSDGQPTFSDEHLYDKFIVMAMDLDKRTTFSATRINSMTSGERVSINRKYKTALNEIWRPPMILASNAQPPWPDVAGNLMRRFPIFTFNHPIQQSDPQLFAKLQMEVPLLVIKMARMYLHAVHRYGARCLWEAGVLPQMCHEAKRQYLITSNPLAAFLASDQLVFQLHLEVEATEFRRALMQYTKDNGDRRASAFGIINKVDHGHVFALHGCTMSERVSLVGGLTRTYITGVSLLG